MAMIEITLNGESQSLPDPQNIQLLLDELSLPSKRVAVELNGLVVRRVDWRETLINDGDRIEIVHFVGGG